MENLNFESLPKQVNILTKEVKDLKEIILQLKDSKTNNSQSEYVDADEFCTITGLAKNTFYNYKHFKKLPPSFTRPGSRKSYFLRTDVINWMTSQKSESPKEYCDRKETELSNSQKQ